LADFAVAEPICCRRGSRIAKFLAEKYKIRRFSRDFVAYRPLLRVVIGIVIGYNFAVNKSVAVRRLSVEKKYL
jgi:hypothetical protein